MVGHEGRKGSRRLELLRHLIRIISCLIDNLIVIGGVGKGFEYVFRQRKRSQ